MPGFFPPALHARIKRVHSFEELISTPFADGVNALCWARELPGDFAAVAARIAMAAAGGQGADSGDSGDRKNVVEDGVEEEDDGEGEDSGGILGLDAEFLESLELDAGGKTAVGVMLEDFRRLRELGLQPELNAIRAYPRDTAAELGEGGVRTDVYSWHADSATTEADTWLCTYFGACSEGLANEEARRVVDFPERRAALLREFGGEDAVEGEEFREFLNENCYDLHYLALPGASPIVFGVGNMWRIAVEYPGCPVPPCVHRAPETEPGDPPRLLLIS